MRKLWLRTTVFSLLVIVLISSCATIGGGSSNRNLTVRFDAQGLEDAEIRTRMGRREVLALLGGPDSARYGGRAPDALPGVIHFNWHYVELGVSFVIESTRVKTMILTSPAAYASNGLRVGMPIDDAIKVLGPWYSRGTRGEYSYAGLDLTLSVRDGRVQKVTIGGAN